MSNPFYISYVALWMLVILQSLILLGLVRMVSQLQQSSSATDRGGMSAGEEAPQFDAVSLSGMPIHSRDFVGRLTALLFVSTTCPACTGILQDMEPVSYKTNGNVIVICKAGHEDCQYLAEFYKLNVPVVADVDDRLCQLYKISSVPTAVLINANNRIQSYGQPLQEKVGGDSQEAPNAIVQGVA